MPVTGSELTYNTSASAMQMAQAIFGQGVTVTRASYTGDSRSSAIWSNGNAISPDATPSNTGVILSTGQVADFTQRNGDPNRATDTSTNTSGRDGNAAFDALAGTRTYDAAWLDVDFVPTGNVMTIQFVFSSEEYPEYVNSIYNDIVGVWVNGAPVDLAVGSGDISVTNVNANNAQNLYISNQNDDYNTEMDGFTVTMTLTFPVNHGVTNSIRIGIADASDANYDSNLLIAGDSLQTALIAMEDVVEMFPGQTRIVDVQGNDLNFTGGTLTITHINGVAVSAGDTVTLASGEQVTLNADGTFSITADADTGTINFTYAIQSSTGLSDTGFVTVTTVPCFVAGTRIATPEGHRPVETLRPGDLVLTHDDGPQPLRWIGRRSVAAMGAHAPIRISAGAFGAHRTLMVSPQHRVLVRDPLAELLFGDTEVLVAAKDLVNGRSVTIIEGGTVEYVHILFDRHQVVWSAGLATESFLPGPHVLGGFEAAVQQEICAIFPELDPRTGAGYSPAARRLLKGYEAQVLFSRAKAA